MKKILAPLIISFNSSFVIVFSVENNFDEFFQKKKNSLSENEIEKKQRNV